MITNNMIRTYYIHIPLLLVALVQPVTLVETYILTAKNILSLYKFLIKFAHEL